MSLDNLAGTVWPTCEQLLDGYGQFGERLPLERTGQRDILCVHLRELIYRRDSGLCCNCRTFGPPFEVDHIVPWSANGPDATANLQLLCSWCNQTKSNRKSFMPTRPSIVTACGYCKEAQSPDRDGDDDFNAGLRFAAQLARASEVPPAGTFGALLRFSPPYPIRQKSANGVPPEPSKFMRRCHRCSASFGLLAAGRSGEAGLWSDSRWWCSQECYDLDHEGAKR